MKAIFPDILVKAKPAHQVSDIRPQAYSRIMAPRDMERLKQHSGATTITRGKRKHRSYHQASWPEQRRLKSAHPDEQKHQKHQVTIDLTILSLPESIIKQPFKQVNVYSHTTLLYQQRHRQKKQRAGHSHTEFRFQIHSAIPLHINININPTKLKPNYTAQRSQNHTMHFPVS